MPPSTQWEIAPRNVADPPRHHVGADDAQGHAGQQARPAGRSGGSGVRIGRASKNSLMRRAPGGRRRRCGGPCGRRRRRFRAINSPVISAGRMDHRRWRFTQITLSTRLETKPRSWETTTHRHPPVRSRAGFRTAGPRPACRRSPSARPSSSSSGWQHSARAMSTRCRWPPERAANGRRARSSMPTWARASSGGAAVGRGVPAEPAPHSPPRPSRPISTMSMHARRENADRAARAAACSPSAAAPPAAAGRRRAPRRRSG